MTRLTDAQRAEIGAWPEHRAAHIEACGACRAEMRATDDRRLAFVGCFILEAKDAATALLAECAALGRERDHWHAHYDAVLANWNETIARAEAAEAQVVALCRALCTCGPADDPDPTAHDALACGYRAAASLPPAPARNPKP